jgi:SAM-dependent methyltransferase
MSQALTSYAKALVSAPRYLATDVSEFFTTITRYYSNAQFRRADLRCLRAYLLRSPYNICQRYLRDLPDARVQKIYGETFFTTLDTIAKAVNLTENDVIYDLGCGRGRGVFWFNAMYKCRAIGVEIYPVFVTEARKIKKKLGIDGVDFIYANLMDIDYDDATVIYFYGTAFKDKAIASVVDRFKSLKPGTRVVSVSYALTAYTDSPVFELEQKIRGKFLWGEADIFIQRRL